MPAGIYIRKPQVKYGGRANCQCGNCLTCTQRVNSRNYFYNNRDKILARRKELKRLKQKSKEQPDKELEDKMIKYFAARGWD